MAIFTKEVAVWRSRMSVVGATIIGTLQEPVKGYAQQGWIGDESSGIPAERFQNGAKNSQLKPGGAVVIDVGALTDDQFSLELARIDARRNNLPLKPQPHINGNLSSYEDIAPPLFVGSSQTE